MATARRQRFVRATVGWMTGAVLLLVLFDALSLELFFVLSLVGFLVVTELTAPFSVAPTWRSRLRWLIALGLLLFAYVVVRQLLSVLPTGVL